MTTTDKLLPLAEQIRTLKRWELCFHPEDGLEMDENGAWLEYAQVDDLAAPYDALIRQQEARIAELKAELATFRELAREAEKLLCYNDPNFEDLAQRLAALHKEE